MKFRILSFLVILSLLPLVVFAADWQTQAAKDWANRDQLASVNKAIALYEKALADTPSDEALLIRLSLAHYWKGNDMLENGTKEARMAAYEKGMAYAKKAIAISPKSVGGNFWYATNLASYSREKGVVKSVTRLGEMREHMKVVTDQEPFYFEGGPQRFHARIITVAPGFLREKFGGSLEQAEQQLKDAIAKYPNFSMSYLFLADVYFEMDKDAEAKALLEKVANMKESRNPPYAAEIRRDRKIAKAKLAKL